MEDEAHAFLRDTVGIPKDKRKPWQCLSCLLSQVYDLFCRAGPEGDALFYKEVEKTKFERVVAASEDDQSTTAWIAAISKSMGSS